MNNSVDGVLHVDKAIGPTSHDVVNVVRRLAGIRRVGHSGTLDPLASGLLILCLGKATRLVEYLVGLDKVYLAGIHLGQETSTYDREGQVINEKPVSVSNQDLREVLGRFQGEIRQVPPMYSALKLEGQPLYKRARAGNYVDRPSRLVTIYDIHLLTWEAPILTVQISCSSGTYIRSIAHDVGQALGCGAHLSSLRRLQIGRYHVDEAASLEKMEIDGWQKHLRPIDSAAASLSKIILSNDEARKVGFGQRIPVGSKPEPDDTLIVRAYDQQGYFVGILESVESHWQPRKIFYQQMG
jgi:tRNA pseudouridine55 synthase